MTTVLETCGISPPPGSAAELSLPLCFFDIFWIHYHPIRRLLFYNHPSSIAEFSTTIVPNLKHSLSLTLKHYLPVAGNLLFPLDTDKSRPLIRYVSGDSTTLTVAVSDRNFDDLTGSHIKESDLFYDLLPPLPPVTDDGNYQIAPLVAVQVTLFPGRGICVGMSNHHCLGDARSVAGFMSAWADINRHGGDERFCSSPVYFRQIRHGICEWRGREILEREGKSPLHCSIKFVGAQQQSQGRIHTPPVRYQKAKKPCFL